MKVLVLAQNYPDNNGYVQLMYIHTRNLYYSNNGFDVEVLNFSAKRGYVKDGITVRSYSEYKKLDIHYDILIIHAPNIRSHYLFLKRYGYRFNRFVFFFHGHEVMRINHDYSKPFEYMKKSLAKRFLQNIYDDFKLNIWRRYIPKIIEKSYFIFVSNWMKDIFIKNVRVNLSSLESHYSIVYNSVGQAFEEGIYNQLSDKEYDFVTIRSNLDDSKYAVDLVNDIANKTPTGKFLIIGKGELFNNIDKAENIVWMNTTLNHHEIVEILNRCRFALMPTRTDAQGLMMCEMAAFGIPVITSDIPVCHEVFDGFPNVFYVDNKNTTSLNNYLNKESTCIKDNRYYFQNTISKEIKILKG